MLHCSKIALAGQGCDLRFLTSLKHYFPHYTEVSSMSSHLDMFFMFVSACKTMIPLLFCFTLPLYCPILKWVLILVKGLVSWQEVFEEDLPERTSFFVDVTWHERTSNKIFFCKWTPFRSHFSFIKTYAYFLSTFPFLCFK